MNEAKTQYTLHSIDGCEDIAVGKTADGRVIVQVGTTKAELEREIAHNFGRAISTFAELDYLAALDSGSTLLDGGTAPDDCDGDSSRDEDRRRPILFESDSDKATGSTVAEDNLEVLLESISSLVASLRELLLAVQQVVTHSSPSAEGSSEHSVEETAFQSPWLTVPEAAKYARCGTKQIYDACRTGELVGRQQSEPHGTWRIHVDDLDDYLRAAVMNPKTRLRHNTSARSRD
ncbi:MULTISPECIES: helix-turn-helix domain-containing protein [Rhodococcus]|uniref:helix-turn-helix domain-containing protein n=1 Tax=Rhodococcus TaxID=1827 RepID=UPI001E3FFCF3|nr:MULTISPECIES: helix-turn-helix domain-containing protein [Rhodococcus]BDB58941.1 hypothetical protein RDE2_07350 [Rhodococcus sp. RDE2]